MAEYKLSPFVSFHFLFVSVCDISAVSVQDRLNHDAEELEMRLSLLSHSTGTCLPGQSYGNVAVETSLCKQFNVFLKDIHKTCLNELKQFVFYFS